MSITIPKGTRIKSDEMNNEKSCEKHDALPAPRFLALVNLHEMNQCLRSFGMATFDEHTKETKLLQPLNYARLLNF